MLVLALDTSSDISVALVRDGATLAARTVHEQRRHAELLSPLVAEVLAEAGVRPAELDAVAAGTGPAPFTGLRAGLVTARALAFAVGVPVLGVGSLEVLAAQAFEAGAPRDAEVLVAADARRREVYVGSFRVADTGADVSAGDRVAPGAVVDVVAARPLDVLRPADVERGTASVLVGPGAALLAEAVGLAAAEPSVLDAAVLARLAAARAARGLDQPTEPLYLRRPDAVPSVRAAG